MIKNTKFLKDTSLYLFSAGLSKLLMFILIPYLTVYLSVEEFGRYDLLLTSIGFISIFFAFGLPQVLQLEFFHFDKEKKQIEDIFSAHFSFSIPITIIIVVMSLIFNHFHPFIKEDITIIIVLLISLLSFYQVSLQNILRLKSLTYFYFKQSAVTSCFQFLSSIIVLLYFQNKVIWLLSILFLTNTISVLISSVKLKINLNFKDIKWKLLFEKSKDGLILVLSYGAYWLINGADRMIVLKILGEHQQGIYSIAMRIASTAEPLLLTPLISVILPISFKKYATNIYKEDILKWSLITIIFFTVCAIISPYILPFLISKETPKSVFIIIPYFIFSYSFYFIAQFCSNILVYHKKFKILLLNITVVSFLSITLNVILLNKTGIVGGAYAFLITNIIWSLLSIVQRFRFVKKIKNEQRKYS